MIKQCRWPFWFGCCLLALAIAGACSTKRPPQFSTAVRPEERNILTSRAKPPQQFGLTAYSSDNGVVFGGAFRQNQNHIDRIDFASSKNTTTPIIGVGDGKSLMLIDSTAAESWITFDTAMEWKLTAIAGPELFTKNPVHVYDALGGFAAVMPRMNIGKLYLENAVFYVREAIGPLDGLTRWEKTPYIHGVLGADFLRSFEFVRISLRGRQVILCGANRYPYADSAITTLPIVNLNGGIAVECAVDGVKQPVLLDIAGDFEFAHEDSREPVVRQITMGDLVFRQVEAVSAFDLGMGMNSPPRIGRQLLERYDLVINQKGRQLLVEMPTAR